MGVKEHVLFKLINIFFLNMLGVFGQPSVQSWNAVISSRYSRRTNTSKSCVFPFNVGDKYYSDCFHREGESRSVCCTSILGGSCTESSLEVCEFNRQTNRYLPAFVTVTGSYTVDPYGEVNGTYVFLNLQYDGEKPSPLYQQITGESESSGYFFSFSETKGSWVFFADWRRVEAEVLRSDLRGQQPDLLPIDSGLGHFVNAYNQYEDIHIHPYTEVPSSPILSDTRDFCSASCSANVLKSEIIKCTETCRSECSGRGYFDFDTNTTCTCFSNYHGSKCQYFCNKNTCDPTGATSKSSNTCGSQGQCICSAQNDRIGRLCQYKCDAATDCNGNGVCNINATSTENICICNKDWYGSTCNFYCNDKETCHDHGKCTGVSNPKVCTCDQDYVGENCQYQCSNDKTCNGKGVCGADGKCICDAGRIGEFCEYSCTDLTTCSGHGSCAIDYARKKAVCECDCNYFGEDCSMQNSTCVASGYCKHGSCCTDTDNCLCKPGGYGGVVYYGKQCDIEPTGCDESFCGGHGSCVFNKTGPFSVQCECTKPFFGPNCETCRRGNGMKCDCDSGCSGHGSCGSDGQCDCACNYFGNFCQFYDEKCVEAHYCDNGGCCTGTNYCDCPGDNLFGETCDVFFDNCTETLCGNRGRCLKSEGDGNRIHLYCVCDKPFEGEKCKQCKVHGLVGSQNTCECLPGWKGEECNINIASERLIATISILTTCLLLSIGPALAYHFYTTVWKLDLAPSDYDDFASLTNLTRKERTCGETILEFTGRCFVHYIFCTPCRDYRSYKHHKGGERHFRIRSTTDEDNHGLRMNHRGLDLRPSFDNTDGFGEVVPLSYQIMED